MIYYLKLVIINCAATMNPPCGSRACVSRTCVAAARPLTSPNGGSVLRSSVALSTYLRWYLHTLAETSLVSQFSILPVWLQHFTFLYSAYESFYLSRVLFFQFSQSLAELIQFLYWSQVDVSIVAVMFC